MRTIEKWTHSGQIKFIPTTELSWMLPNWLYKWPRIQQQTLPKRSSWIVQWIHVVSLRVRPLEIIPPKPTNMYETMKNDMDDSVAPTTSCRNRSATAIRTKISWMLQLVWLRCRPEKIGCGKCVREENSFLINAVLVIVHPKKMKYFFFFKYVVSHPTLNTRR